MKQFLILSTLFLVALTGLSAQKWLGIRGEGPVVKKDLSISGFDQLGLAISADVFVNQGATTKVTVEGQANLIDNLVTEVKNGKWTIKFRDNVRSMDGMRIYVTMPNVSSLGISGSGDIVVENGLRTGDLGLHISGSGSIKVPSLQGSGVEAHISGSGSVILSGQAQKLEIHISGSGDVDALGLNASACAVHVSGSGDCTVDVKEALDVHISGSGDVRYKGQPRLMSKVSGSGSVSTY